MEVSGRVAMLGHSYLSRLETGIRVDQTGRFARNLGLRGVIVRIFARSGGRIDHLWELVRQMKGDGYRPSVVVLQVGGNDLDGRDYSRAHFMAHFRGIVESLRAWGVSRVVVMAIFPRTKPRHVSREVYRSRRADLNMALRLELQPQEDLVFFRRQRLMPSDLILAGDGVHLQAGYVRRYYYVLRYICIRELRLV